MRRRSVLAGVGGGLCGLLAGCLDRSSIGAGADSPPFEEPVVVSDLTKPGGGEPLYAVSTSLVDDEPAEHHFEDFSEAAQREFANAVVRQWYFPLEPPAIRDEDAFREPVQFGDHVFRPVYSAGSGSVDESDEWDPPVELRAGRTDDRLVLRLENHGDASIEVVSSSPPVFMALLAYAPSAPIVLEHENYHEHDGIDVLNDVVYTGTVAITEATEPLPPGEANAFQESYTIPDGVTGEHTVRFDVVYLHDGLARTGIWELSNLV